jgi:hypothetical protein
VNRPQDSADAIERDDATAPASSPLRYIETTVHGTTQTGLTVLGADGKAVFFGDEVTRLPEPSSSSTAPRASEADVPTSKLYPHWHVEPADIGLAVRAVGQAVQELQKAIEAGEDSPGFLNAAVIAQKHLFEALPHSTFNRAFELLVQAMAWGLKNYDIGKDGKAPSVTTLCAVLREIREQPFLELQRAAKLLKGLESQGWVARSPIETAFEKGFTNALQKG